MPTLYKQHLLLEMSSKKTAAKQKLRTTPTLKRTKTADRQSPPPPPSTSSCRDTTTKWPLLLQHFVTRCYSATAMSPDQLSLLSTQLQQLLQLAVDANAVHTNAWHLQKIPVLDGGDTVELAGHVNRQSAHASHVSLSSKRSRKTKPLPAEVVLVESSDEALKSSDEAVKSSDEAPESDLASSERSLNKKLPSHKENSTIESPTNVKPPHETRTRNVNYDPIQPVNFKNKLDKRSGAVASATALPRIPKRLPIAESPEAVSSLEGKPCKTSSLLEKSYPSVSPSSKVIQKPSLDKKRAKAVLFLMGKRSKISTNSNSASSTQDPTHSIDAVRSDPCSAPLAQSTSNHEFYIDESGTVPDAYPAYERGSAPPAEYDSQERKRLRASRFESVNQPLVLKPVLQPVDAPKRAVVGTCPELEKSYLRLTSEPDPARVRPPHILERACTHVLERYAANSNYLYFIDQFKSIRQDLTVQSVRNLFTITVYETNARILLENNDLGEFNQCLSQLQQLYPSVAASERQHQLEFFAYRIIYTIITHNDYGLAQCRADYLRPHVTAQHSPWLEIVPQLFDLYVSYKLGDYVACFALLSAFTKHVDALLVPRLLHTHIVPQIRKRGIVTMARAYRKVSVEMLMRHLAFGSKQELLEVFEQQGIAQHVSSADEWDCIASRGVLKHRSV